MKRALIVKKVWLDKIFDEGKVWEMRSAKTNITGKIGLIESGSGMIVGEVEIIGCSEKPIPKKEIFIEFHKVEDLDLLDKWKYAWYLSGAKRYDNPIPYDHPQGAVVWVNINPDQLKSTNIPKKYLEGNDVLLLTDRLQQEAHRKLIIQKETFVLKKLKHHGYEFDDHQEFVQFLKTRCVIETFPNKLQVLRADGELICEWWDTVRFEDDGATFKCICGEKPRA